MKKEYINFESLSLRPQYLNEYIGQEKIKEALNVFISAAKTRNEVLDHILFYGPPGVGKTTLSNIIAHEMDAPLTLVSGPTLEKPADIISILTHIEEGAIIFIDEIHRISLSVEEVLYSALEDYKIGIYSKNYQQTRPINIDLVPFTLIGSTTKPSLLSSPLRACFGLKFHLQKYSEDDLVKIIFRTSKIFNMKISNSAALILAKRARGTPRITNTFYKRARDFATFAQIEEIDDNIAKKTLIALNIDKFGLNINERKYLRVLKERFLGGPVGIEALAYALNEDKKNVEEMYEPYLLQIGFIERTIKGRKLTKSAENYLKSLKM